MKVRFLLRQTQPMALWCAAGLLVAGCAAPANRAPVEDRARAGVVPPPMPAASSPDTVRPALPAADNTGRAGFYTIRPGDTMVRIGLENGQNWRDIARWNGIENPNLIEVGQVLRVVPPGTDPNTVAARAVPPRPLDARPLDGRPAAASAPVAAASAPPAPAPAPAAAREPDDDIAWQWPASGPVATTFDEARSKGLAITGRAGDPVLAAADGRVVYAGSGLRGYGNLVIVKHNATYLTAYAHNRTLLVKEDQSVKRGQKIAEMGASDAERVQLHFEIRKQGKPVDPARLLPPR
jgi:lipoprotein NlpD